MGRVMYLLGFAALLSIALLPSAVEAGTCVQSQKLNASDAAAGDAFGGGPMTDSLDIDNGTLVVGAFLSAEGALIDAGAAYVFTETGGTWTQQARIPAPTPPAPFIANKFAQDVAIDGDTILCGRPAETLPYPHPGGTGAVYVYTRSGTTWTQQARIEPAVRVAGMSFGWSLDLDGDTAVIGAYRDDAVVGSVYVYTRSGTTWTQQAKITPTDGAAGDEFGFSVSIDADTLLIGSKAHDGGRGAVYAYTRSGTTWSLEQKIRSVSYPAIEAFGYQVGVDGDTAAIGSTGFSIGGSARGAISAFVRSGTTWSVQGQFLGDDANENLGWSVALEGDTMVGGSPRGLNPSGVRTGAAYVYTRSGGAWTRDQKINASDGENGDWFGYGVLHEGGTTFVDDVCGDAGAIETTGAVYVFECQPPNTPPTADAGANITIASADVDSTTLTGTVSDADGDALECRWHQDGVPVTSFAAPVSGECLLDLGTLTTPPATGAITTFTLEVTDGTDTTTADVLVTVDNTAPEASADGSAAVILGDNVTLTGSVGDYDGDELSYAWRLEGATTDLATGTITPAAGGALSSLPDTIIDSNDLGVGTHVIELAVDDGTNDEVVASVEVEVKPATDTSAPTLDCNVSPRILRPADGKMHEVVIETNAADDSGVAPSLDVVVDVRGRSRWGIFGRWLCRWLMRRVTLHEVVSIDETTGKITMNLRAGLWGCGWRYIVTVVATDAAGNASTCAVRVRAPSRRRCR